MYSVAEIYDTLSRIDGRKKASPKPYPVHKTFIIGDRRVSIPEIIEKKEWIKQNSHIYDAGCGNGYSLFHFNKKLKCSGFGLSLSKREIEYACGILEGTEGCEGLSFEVGDYNHPVNQKFDVILLIESIKHSHNLNKTIEVLSSSLKTGGIIVLAEDIADERIHEDVNLNYYKETWGLRQIYSRSDYENAFAKFTKIEELDLTGCRKEMSAIILRFGVTLTKLLKWMKIRGKYYSIYGGGMVQELLYEESKMKYKLICYQK